MGQIEDTIEEKVNWHWRNSMRPVRFFALDARAAAPFFILIFTWTQLFFWLLALVSTVIFVFLERRGLTFPSALRAFRSWFVGQKRPAWISLRWRKIRDFK